MLRRSLLLSLTTSSIALFGISYEDQFYPAPDCCDWDLFPHRTQVFANAEFLYWTVAEGGLEYVIRTNNTINDPIRSEALGNYRHTKFDWRPGLRVSAGWYNEPHFWEVIAQYTWLYDKGTRRTEPPSGRALNATFHTFIDDPIVEAESRVGLHYHIGDLLVTRVFDPNPHLRMRVLGGVTFAAIDQSWKVRYVNFDHDWERIRNHWSYLAGGLRVGASVDWFWGCQFYFTGKTSIATFLGSYKNEAVIRAVDVPGAASNPALLGDAHDRDTRFAFHVQGMLGPSWQRPYDCWAIELFLGYEFNIWMNLQEIHRTTRSVHTGDKESRFGYGLLGLYGLTARLTIGF